MNDSDIQRTCTVLPEFGWTETIGLHRGKRQVSIGLTDDGPDGGAWIADLKLTVEDARDLRAQLADVLDNDFPEAERET